MCFGGSPTIPEATPAPVLQELKQPTTAAATTDKKKAVAGIAGGSLLTGPSGAMVASENIAGGANTFLGA